MAKKPKETKNRKSRTRRKTQLLECFLSGCNKKNRCSTWSDEDVNVLLEFGAGSFTGKVQVCSS